MVSEFNQWREILPSNMAAGLFIERLLGNKQSRMVERIGSIVEKSQVSRRSRFVIVMEANGGNSNDQANGQNGWGNEQGAADGTNASAIPGLQPPQHLNKSPTLTL